MMNRLFKDPANLLSLLALLVYSVSPPFASYDSYWTVPVALNILERGTTDIDRFVPAGPTVAYYAVECVAGNTPAVPYNPANACKDGHSYNFYPLAVSLFALPAVFLMKLFVGILHIPPGPSPSPVGSFFSGDFIAGHILAELWSASFYSACAVWFFYRLIARLISRRSAILLTLLFAFGTAQWSIASRSLMQHGLTVFLLTAVLYFLVKALRRPRFVAYAALPLAAAFTVRPSNALSVIVFTAFVAIHFRSQLARFLLWSLPVAIPFLSYNLLVRHSLLPSYFHVRPSFIFSSMVSGGMAQLFSPSRGLFIFTPVFLLSLWGMYLACRARWLFPLTPYLIAIVAVHTILVAPWLPGHTYGSRYFADITPFFVLFLIPVAERWRMRGRRPLAAAAFVLLAACGVFIHARGGTSAHANMWSSTPVSVDQKPSRVWDWSDPQFLRGLRR